MFNRALKNFLIVFFTVGFVVLFAVGYSRYRQQSISADVQPVGSTPTPVPNATGTPGQSAGGTPPPGTTTPAATPSQSRASYTGTTYRVPWGNVTVAITVQNGKLVAVSTPDYPNSPPSQYAHAQLISQALAAGSANIQGVSGATYTSLAFTRSLESALSKVPAASQPQSLNTNQSSQAAAIAATATPAPVNIPRQRSFEDD